MISLLNISYENCFSGKLVVARACRLHAALQTTVSRQEVIMKKADMFSWCQVAIVIDVSTRDELI